LGGRVRKTHPGMRGDLGGRAKRTSKTVWKKGEKRLRGGLYRVVD